MKALALRQMHRRDLRLFTRCCDRVYFPSASFARLFADRPFHAVGLLPPGCLPPSPPHDRLFHRLLYVGGLSPAYGASLLLQAFDRLWSGGCKVELVLCCRKEEAALLPPEAKNAPYLTLIHAQGDELAAWYRRCDAGLLPLLRDRYMDLSLPVKLFEYWGAGLPVITTDCPETAAMVRRYGAGLVCAAAPEALAEAVRQFYCDEALPGTLRRGVERAAGENRWVDRAAQVVRELTAGEGAKSACKSPC